MRQSCPPQNLQVGKRPWNKSLQTEHADTEDANICGRVTFITTTFLPFALSTSLLHWAETNPFTSILQRQAQMACGTIFEDCGYESRFMVQSTKCFKKIQKELRSPLLRTLLSFFLHHECISLSLYPHCIKSSSVFDCK